MLLCPALVVKGGTVQTHKLTGFTGSEFVADTQKLDKDFLLRRLYSFFAITS